MLNRRLPHNADIPPGTHDGSTHLVPPLILCLHSSCASTTFPTHPAVFAALRGIGAVSLGDTPASVAILRSLACASPPVAIARAQHQAWNKFKARCCRTDKQRY
ncbi:MAG: hypothetical protein IKI10_08280 [Muribaculaceae bacterium]|nr:hypothetical protein [Muribaculaceae bacterium]